MDYSEIAVATVAWRTHVRRLTEDCICGPPAQQHRALIQMRELLEAAPPEVLTRVMPLADPTAFEEFAAAGASESAVLALLGPRAAFMCSRGSSGLHIATLVMLGSDEEHSGEGASFALAMLAALGEALLAAAPGEAAR